MLHSPSHPSTSSSSVTWAPATRNIRHFAVCFLYNQVHDVACLHCPILSVDLVYATRIISGLPEQRPYLPDFRPASGLRCALRAAPEMGQRELAGVNGMMLTWSCSCEWPNVHTLSGWLLRRKENVQRQHSPTMHTQLLAKEISVFIWNVLETCSLSEWS